MPTASRFLRSLLLCTVAPVARPMLAQADTARPSAADVREQRDRARTLRVIARADSLLRAGRVTAAETLYYDLARWRPRDPASRLALGRYLAARGALKIGAVLIEEAREFGANPAVAAIYLAPLYTRLGAWQSLRELSAAPITAGERERLGWMFEHPSTVTGPESVTVVLRAASLPALLGAVVIRIGGDSIIADLDPDARGITLDQSRVQGAGVRRFSGGSPDVRQAAGVIEQARIGDLSFSNVPVTFGALGGASRARIGLDFLASFAPTVDRGRLTLRRSGRLSSRPRGSRYALLIEPTAGARIARGGRLERLTDGLSRELRDTPWTLDTRMGELVVHR